MSYAFSGKLAGMGDASSTYASAMVAYQTDHDAWLKEKAAYDRAVQAYAAASAGAASSYAAAMAAYNAQNAARAAAVAAAQRQQLANQVARDRANTAARAAGVVTPPGYPGCVSQAQHDAWQADCARVSATVKGLGADPTGSSCALALLPVCQPPVPMPPPLGPAPARPAALTPPPALRPEPRPPAPPPASSATPGMPGGGPSSVPATVPVSSSIPQSTPPASAAATRSAGLVKNGLILVVIAGGGYALYRTFKKPKAS